MTRVLTLLSLSLLLTSLLLSGAIGSWPSFRGDELNSGSSGSEMEVGQENGLALKWEFRSDGRIQGAVVGNDDLISFNTLNGSLYVLRRSNGELVFKRQPSDSMFNAPLMDVERGRVVIATGLGEVISYSLPDGSKAWNSTLGEGRQVHSSPKVRGNVIVVPSYDSNIYALDAVSGEFLWTFEGCGGQVHTTPSFYEKGGLDLVLFGSCDGRLYALHRTNGTLYWSFEAEYIPSSPAISGSSVYFGSFDGNIRCLDIPTGELIWSTDLDQPIFSSPAVLDDHICVGADDGKLYLLDSVTGDILWNRTIMEGSLTTSPVLVLDLVLITSDRGLEVLSGSDGAVLRGFELGDSSESSPSVIGELIFFGDAAGYVRAVGTKEDNGGGPDPLEIGKEDDLQRDVVVLMIGLSILLIIGIALYIGYVRMRGSE